MATYCTCTPVQGYRGNIHAKSTQTPQWIPCCTGSQTECLSLSKYKAALKKKSLYGSTCIQIHKHNMSAHTYPPTPVDILRVGGGEGVAANIHLRSYLYVWIREPFTPKLTLQLLPLPRAAQHTACSTHTHTHTHPRTHTHSITISLSRSLSFAHTDTHTLKFMAVIMMWNSRINM